MGTLRAARGRGGPATLIPAALIAVCVLAVVVIGVLAVTDPFSTDTVDRSGPAVLEQIRELEEFTAAEGSFTQDVDLESDTRFLPDFLRGERAVAIVTGSVRATVDFGALDEDAIEVDEDRTSIRLRLPEPELSDVDIEESSARVVSRSRGLLDRIGDFFGEHPTDDGPLFEAAEQKVAEAAAGSDLVADARATTERWLRTFLGAAGFESVEVSWYRPPT